MTRHAETYERLLAEIRPLESVAIAFSGGVDSTLLLDACAQALGPERVLAVTLDTPYVARSELKDACRMAARSGVRHEVLGVPFAEALRTNPVDRCYLCKRDLLERLRAVAASQDYAQVLEGSNVDDLGEHRPGMRAVRELGVLSPLLAAGLDKGAVRELSRWRDLDTWDKPAQTCLLTRFPHGESITEVELRRVEAAEAVLRDMGFAGARVRSHGELARIEVVPERVVELARCGQEVHERLSALGFAFVGVDLGGYKSGSFNRVAKSALRACTKALT